MRILGLCLVLVCAVWCAYANAIFHPFVHDDTFFILQNPRINHIDLNEIFFTFTPNEQVGVNAYYRPLLELIYRLEYKAFEFDPAAFHAVNIAGHSLNTLLVFAIALSLGCGLWFAFAISLFFGIHPVQSEAVACVAGISNIAVAFFVLGAWLSYIRGWFIPAILLFIVGLLAKETALVFIPIAIVTDWYLRRRQWMAWGIIICIGLLFLGWRQALTHSSLLADIAANPQELVLRLLHIPTALVMYVKSVVWPGDLHYYRSLDILKAWWPYWIALIVGIGGLVFVSPSDKERRRLYWFGLIIFISCLLPILNIVPLINEYSLILIADHFVYLPLIGLLISLGCCLEQWLLPYRRKYVVIITALLALFGTIYQNTFWQSEVALFERTVHFQPSFGRAQALLARAYYFEKRYDKALTHYTYAEDIFKKYLQQTQAPSAVNLYRGFLKGVYFESAQAYVGLGKFDMAQEQYAKAIEQDPHDANLYNNLATVLMTQGQWDSAKKILQQSIKLNPSNLMARSNLGVCYINTGYPDIAKIIWRHILMRDPNFVPALQNLSK